MSVSGASILSLPMETHFQVLGHLDSQSIEVVKTVCVWWRDIIQDPSFRSTKENKLNAEYSTKMQELVNCICLLPRRLARIPDITNHGIWRLYSIDTKDEGALVEYNSKLEEFYQAFKERAIFQHHYVDSQEFMSSAKAVNQELYFVAVSCIDKIKLPLDVFLDQTQFCNRSFYAKTFEDLIRTCASHFKIVRSQNIFNQVIAFLKIYCPSNYKEKFKSLPDIIIGADSLNDNADPTDVIEYKIKGTVLLERHAYQQRLKSTIDGLEKEYVLLETRLIDLRGTNGFNGAIDLAFKNGDTNKYNELNSELHALAQFDNNGNIIGGSFFDLSQRINKLKSEYDAIANAEFLGY